MSLISQSVEVSGPAVAAATSPRLEPSIAGVGDYVALMKPRVMSLVLFTALVGIMLAPGHIHPVLGLTALVCIAVGAGAAAALVTAHSKTQGSQGEAPAAQLLRDGLGLASGQPDLPAPEIDASGWLKELLSSNHERKLHPVEVPASFDGQLRPYQERGLAWLSFLSTLGLGACLADDMGLGKTVQLLALLLAERDGLVADRNGDRA